MRISPLVSFLIGFALCVASVAAWGRVNGARDVEQAMAYQTGAVVLAIFGATLVIASALYDIERRR